MKRNTHHRESTLLRPRAIDRGRYGTLEFAVSRADEDTSGVTSSDPGYLTTDVVCGIKLFDIRMGRPRCGARVP
jgi:hypothetical protein